MSSTSKSLGDLISLFYEEYLELYGDPDLASVATAATINSMLVEMRVDDESERSDAALSLLLEADAA